MSAVGFVTGAVMLFAAVALWRSHSSHTTPSLWRGAVPLALTAGVALGLVAPSVAHAGIEPGVPLGTAEDFSVLGGQSVTNTGPSVLPQSVGVLPGTAIDGFPPGIVNPPGTIEPNTAVAQGAQDHLTTAYKRCGRGAEYHAR